MTLGRVVSLVVVGFIALAFMGVCTALVHRVDPGYAGVIVDYGKGTADGQPAISSIPTAQYIFINPTQAIAQYPVAQQTLTMVRREKEGQVVGDDSVECRDNGGIRVHLDSSTLWRADQRHVGDLYLLRPKIPLVGKDGEDISSTVVRREVRNAMVAACALYSFGEIFGNKRQDYSESVVKVLGAQLAKSYIQLDDFLLGELFPDKDQLESLNRIANAKNAATEASFAKLRAENEASARIAEAEGNARAIEIIQKQLERSPEYISYLYANKWNGQYPQTMIGGQLPGGGQFPVVGTIPVQPNR